ncbi:hypothetical protein I2I11_09560 [Pontibacter sp. 172403-2]|uniref:hypothetical protein n=1 Tax=Pontibacter rufus TaxID=2791028 RepID=UPI0018AFE068|nr:hypothetical protein [Pontibacter sp. 172403-2]MBF9253538.1 hypothetical protein [Pontibacter sp. 172403-2]
MKTSILYTFLFTWMTLTMSACNSDNEVEPQLQLETVGFSGTLPDGRAFSKQGVVSDNNLISSSSSVDGSFISHVLSVSDLTSGTSIIVELPYVKFSNDFGVANDSVLNHAATEYYPYQVVKEKLSVGDKLILSSQASDPKNSFRVQVIDQKNYSGFSSEGSLSQAGSYLKVIKVIEGTETEPILGNVKTLEVIFDLDVKLYSSGEGFNESGNLKGLLRMKYREI